MTSSLCKHCDNPAPSGRHECHRCRGTLYKQRSQAKIQALEDALGEMTLNYSQTKIMLQREQSVNKGYQKIQEQFETVQALLDVCTREKDDLQKNYNTLALSYKNITETLTKHLSIKEQGQITPDVAITTSKPTRKKIKALYCTNQNCGLRIYRGMGRRPQEELCTCTSATSRVVQ